MVGTITQTINEQKHFEYGVRRYPELDNPVWFSSDEDLDVIFDKAAKPNNGAVWLGCRLRIRGVPGERFTGDMDELFIANGALQPHEIVRLMNTNSVSVFSGSVTLWAGFLEKAG